MSDQGKAIAELLREKWAAYEKAFDGWRAAMGDLFDGVAEAINRGKGAPPVTFQGIDPWIHNPEFPKLMQELNDKIINAYRLNPAFFEPYAPRNWRWQTESVSLPGATEIRLKLEYGVKRTIPPSNDPVPPKPEADAPSNRVDYYRSILDEANKPNSVASQMMRDAMIEASKKLEGGYVELSPNLPAPGEMQADKPAADAACPVCGSIFYIKIGRYPDGLCKVKCFNPDCGHMGPLTNEQYYRDLDNKPPANGPLDAPSKPE